MDESRSAAIAARFRSHMGAENENTDRERRPEGKEGAGSHHVRPLEGRRLLFIEIPVE
jgi:hypothetical protein